MLGLYVHTHWAYSHPYAARTWSVEDWRGYLGGHRWQLEPLAAADGIVIIDSDPGGYIGSTNDQFVELLRAKITLFRQLNPKAELVYWMWFGWENYNRFWAEVQSSKPGDAPP